MVEDVSDGSETPVADFDVVAEEVVSELHDAGINAQVLDRGLTLEHPHQHGLQSVSMVWVWMNDRHHRRFNLIAHADGWDFKLLGDGVDAKVSDRHDHHLDASTTIAELVELAALCFDDLCRLTEHD